MTTENLNRLDSLRNELNTLSSLYFFPIPSVKDGDGSVNERYNTYQNFGSWRINVSIPVENIIESYGVDISLSGSISVQKANSIISKANTLIKNNDASIFNRILLTSDDNYLLQNYKGSLELTKRGENKGYIRGAFHKHLRGTSRDQIPNIVENLLSIIAFLQLLETLPENSL